MKFKQGAPNAILEVQWCREKSRQKMVLHRVQLFFHSGKFKFIWQLLKSCSLPGRHQYLVFFSFFHLHFFYFPFWIKLKKSNGWHDQVPQLTWSEFSYHLPTFKSRFSKHVQMRGESMSQAGARSHGINGYFLYYSDQEWRWLVIQFRTVIRDILNKYI